MSVKSIRPRPGIHFVGILKADEVVPLLLGVQDCEGIGDCRLLTEGLGESKLTLEKGELLWELSDIRHAITSS